MTLNDYWTRATLNKIGVLAAATSLSACAAFTENMTDGYLVDTAVTYKNAEIYGDNVQPAPFNLDTGRLPGRNVSALVDATPDPSITARPARAQELARAKAARNRLAYYLMDRSNHLCQSHRAGIAAISSGVNFSLSEGATLLSTAGALVNGERAAQILNGLSAAVNATRSNFNENIYQNLLMPAILESIQNTRNNLRTTIVTALETRNPDVYPVEAAIVDVNIYHAKCSFVEGLSSLAQAAENLKITRDEREAKIQQATKRLNELRALVRVHARSKSSTAKTRETLNAAMEAAAAELAQLYGESGNSKPGEGN